MKKRILLSVSILLICLFFSFMASEVMAAEGDPPVDPYAMPWCTMHKGCGTYQVRNQTDYWLQVYAMYGDTKEKGFFTIPPKGYAKIQVQPGRHYVTYVYWCNGEMEIDEFAFPLSGWVDWFKCPQGMNYSYKQ